MWKEKMTGQDLDAYTRRLIQQVEAEGLLPAPAPSAANTAVRSLFVHGAGGSGSSGT